jgi:hypothetical protein
MVNLIFRYFNLFAFAANLLNFWMVRNRASFAVKIYLASLSALPLIWWLLQVIGGYSSFLFVILPPRQYPLAAVFWLFDFIFSWGCMVWVIWGNGAEELLKMNLSLGKKSRKTPQSIKLSFVVTSVVFPVLVILGYSSGFFSSAVANLGDLIF